MPGDEPSKGLADAIDELQRLVEALRAPSEKPSAPPQDKSPEPLPDLETVMGLVRAKVYARRAGVPESNEPTVEIPKFTPPPAEPPRFLRAPPRLAIRDRYSLSELLACSDADFVHNVYRAILHRDADGPGYLHHYSLLSRGDISRIEMLEQFRLSADARAHHVTIDGLRRALLLQRMSRWPLVGKLISLAWHLRNLPITVARLDAQERRLFAAEQDLRFAVDALSQATEAAIHTVSGSLRRLDREKASRAQQVALTGRVAALSDEMSRLADGAKREDLLRITQALLSAIVEVDGRKADIVAAAGGPKTDIVTEALGFDQFYVAFENTFRGTRAQIKERVQVYLPIVKALERGPVVDIGCGRGEWLELLKESGIEARGVDMNRTMIEECRTLGIEAVESDAIEYLAALPAASLAAVTGIHVVEHLPYPRLLTLLDETRRVLRPGGVAIFETPNPENIIVGSCNFWYDPTHERPLPPESLKRVAELRGFCGVEILRLHPFPVEAHFAMSSPARDQLNHLFYGPQDYAIVARKAAGDDR